MSSVVHLAVAVLMFLSTAAAVVSAEAQEIICPLKNRYFALRHGESMANQKGIIVSQPENGLEQYGLTAAGYEQARQAGRQIRSLAGEPVIFSSDFLRARETAQTAGDEARVKEIRYSAALRERSFGNWELGSNTRYHQVWEKDAADAAHTDWGSESVLSVRTRTVALINDLETRYTNRTIVLVSHGDTLQILQTAFNNIPPATHRKLEPLKTGELRALECASPRAD